MCGRYILVQKQEVIEKRYNAVFDITADYSPSYNISPGQYAPIVLHEGSNVIKMFRFGLTPHWSKKNMLLINARTEGDYNKLNDTEYNGNKGIISKPSFRKPIRSQRCLIPADAFYEGPELEKLSKPYLVYLIDKVRPFSFAGIFDTWHNEETGEIINSFAIITTVANTLLKKIPHHRSPVILPQSYEQKWLNPKIPLSDVTNMLRPYPGDKMNAYPVSPEVKNPANNSRLLINPTGDRIEKEFITKTKETWELSGMGSGKKFTYNKENPWGE